MSTKLKTTESIIHYEYITCPNPNADSILFVHGLGLDLTIWDDVLPFFTSEYNVLRYDMRGYGKSTIIKNKKFSWEMLINDLLILLEKLSITSIHFVGHSGGGNFGLEAAKKANIVKSLTLISTPICPPKEITTLEIQNRYNRAKSKNLEDIILPIVKTMCFPSTEKKINRLLSIYKQVSLTAYLDHFHLLSQTILNYSIKDFQDNSIPVLLLAGEYDVLYPPQLHSMSLNQINNSRLYVIPNAGNAVMVDQPEIFSNYTKNFIGNVTNNRRNHQQYVYTETLMRELQSIVNKGIYENHRKNNIHLRMVQHFSVTMDGKGILGKWNQRKAKSILAYILYHQSVVRDQLVDAFWPDYDIKKARNYLRVSINHIKTIIEESTGNPIEKYLFIDRDTISLTCDVTVDLVEILEKIQSIEQEMNIQQKVEQAILVFGALPDTICSGFYDDWILDIRTKLENTIIKICEELLDATLVDTNKADLLRILIKYNPTEKFYFEQLSPLLKKLNKHKELDYLERKIKIVEEIYH
jgi:pimeloyl-ACP methyl ester carboxylesterase/DNA-binding SARP family transcriptional activator